MSERAQKVEGWLQMVVDPTVSEFALRGVLRDAERLIPQLNAPADAAPVYLVIANIHFALRNFEKAGEAYQRGYNLEKTNAALINGIGVAHLALGRIEKAIEFLSLAYKAHAASSNRYDQVVTLSNLAEAYWYTGEQEGALEALRAAKDLADSSSEADMIVLANQATEIGAIGDAAEFLAQYLSLHRKESVAVADLPAALTGAEREFLARRHGVAKLIRKLDLLPDAPSRFAKAAPVDGTRVGGAADVFEETRTMRGRATAVIFGDSNELRPE